MNTEKAIERVLRKVERLNKEFNRDIHFIDFKQPWGTVPRTKARVILYDNQYNIKGELTFDSFAYGKEVKWNHIKIIEEQAINHINKRMEELKPSDCGIKSWFVEFVGGWKGARKTKVKIANSIGETIIADYRTVVEVGLSNSIDKLQRNKESKRIPMEKGISLIKEHAKYLSTSEIEDVEFVEVVGKWIGVRKSIIKVKINDAYEEMTVSALLQREPKGGDRKLHETYCYNIIKDFVENEPVIREHILEGVVPGTFVKLDFYLPERNTVIEYDGIQHYKFVEHFHKTYETYVERVRRDKLVKEYCLENNIKFLRISYKDNNRLEEVINTFLKTGEDISTHVDPILLPAVINN